MRRSRESKIDGPGATDPSGCDMMMTGVRARGLGLRWAASARIQRIAESTALEDANESAVRHGINVNGKATV